MFTIMIYRNTARLLETKLISRTFRGDTCEMSGVFFTGKTSDTQETSAKVLFSSVSGEATENFY